MSFADERLMFEAELDAYYTQAPAEPPAWESELHAESARHPAWLPWQRKAMGYRQIATRCPVVIFRSYPFFFELQVGKPRTDLGDGGIGGWMKREPFGRQLHEQGRTWWALCEELGLSVGWWVVDDNHHSIGNDVVFQYGLTGLLHRATDQRAVVTTAEERAFLDAMITGLQAEIDIANRFAAEAERLLHAEEDPTVRARLARIADTARRVPAAPPTTFYEALATLLFMREVTQALEANGNSILGHLDRILWPYYERDLAAGRLTRAEAKDLLSYLLALPDVRFGMRRPDHPWHVGTNTTLVIGGCTADGRPVFNELTRLIIEVRRELPYVDPKINARITAQHPHEYFYGLAELVASGDNGVAIFNDEVIIPANVAVGKALADCRLYVGGGCQENLLENSEVNSRATMYLNLLQVFLAGFFPERLAPFVARAGITLTTYDACATFDGLYTAFLANLGAVTAAHIDQRNRTEAEGVRFNPCPLHSATVHDCIANATDMMAGGARYNAGSVSLTGVGTLCDALLAVRDVVYLHRRCAIPELAASLAGNFVGAEEFRQLLLRLPKYGHENSEVDAVATRLFADLARVTSGQPNTRGGSYEASLFSFTTFLPLGRRTGATPDGRRAGDDLSAGHSPSLLALGAQCSVGQVLDCLRPLDLTRYPVVGVLDIKMPLQSTPYPPEILTAVIQRFLANGGSVLQINVVDPALLVDARAHPARHSDLIVRVSGYSAYFTTLAVELQEQIIARTLVGVAGV